MNRKLRDRNDARKALKYRGTKCLNCKHPIDKSDIYCPYCSQINSTKQLSATDFFNQFLSSILVYDSRLRSTLKDLLFKPGVITRNYVKGQRLKYANPFRFFLSVSIIFFLINGLLDATNTEIKNNFATPKVSLTPEEQKAIDSLGIELNSFTSTIISLADTIRDVRKTKPLAYLSEAQLDSLPFTERYAKRLTLYNDFYERHKIKNAKVALDSLHHKNTTFNRWVYSKNATVEKIIENPSAFGNYLIGKIPFFLFFYAPLFACFFWLLYSRKKYNYLEHLIFIFHIFSFIFLVLLIAVIPEHFLNTSFITGSLFLLIGPFYFYKALRNFYQESRIVTLLKFVFLNIAFFIGFSIATVLFVAASAALY